jgi:hypothetical protein
MGGGDEQSPRVQRAKEGFLLQLLAPILSDPSSSEADATPEYAENVVTVSTDS